MLSTTPVSVDEFRTKLSEFIGRVVYARDRIVIKKYNRKAAVLLNIDEYEQLIDPTKRFTKDQWKKKFLVIDTIRDSIVPQDQETLAEEVNRAVRQVRAEKKQYGQKT